jgi:sugar/nucleoside kinase (ribokinase family)
MGKRIVVAGHICLDITPVFSQTGFQKEKEIFTSGKLINMQGVDVHTGGVVSNSGLGLMMLGASVTLMGMVGKDDFGNIILDQLKKYHLDEEMIVSDNASTSYSIVLAPPGTDRIFLHDPGSK